MHSPLVSSAARATLASACLVLFAAQPDAQESRLTLTNGLPVRAPAGWYAGDTHDHIQHCDGSLSTTQNRLSRMRDESLSVSSVLIWNPYLIGGGQTDPFATQVCRVTGFPVPFTGREVLQYGVETSGLDASKWGHLIGLNIGPNEARISIALDPGDCYWSATGLGLGCASNDGTGSITAPVARHFGQAPRAVRGMAHQAWPTDLYSSYGYDWNTELLQSGFTSDALCLDNSKSLAFPPVFGLFSNRRQLFPLLQAQDVALGNIEFLETGDMGYDYSFGLPVPAARWYGAYYRLLNAGLRPSPAVGRDDGCAPLGTQLLGLPRTWVDVEGPLTYESWLDGLTAGRVSVSMGHNAFLDLEVNAEGIGGQIELDSPSNLVSVVATLHSTTPRIDWIDIVQDGVVVASQRVRMRRLSSQVSFEVNLDVERSGWIAARLRSRTAHTAATFVIVDDEPIANALDAEYWMLWGDRVAKETLDNPGVHFGCQDDEVLDEIAEARGVFRNLRDYDYYDGGFDPGWGVSRIGASTAACRGPITMGIEDRPVAGNDFTLLSLNAPPNAQGLLYFSTGAGTPTCYENVEVWLDTGALLGAPIPVSSLASGVARTTISGPAVSKLKPGATFYAQYAWFNTADCPGSGCDGQGSAMSTSDALRIVMQ